MVDKVKAEELRLSGMSYDEIASTLGCSVSWCKANLKGIKQPNEDKPIIAEIRRLGRTSNGTTWGEINKVIKEAYPNMEKKIFIAKSKALRKAAREGCPDVIIRPNWMLPSCAQDCTNTIMDMAQELYEQIQQTAKKYRKLYNLDASYQSSIVMDLSKLSASKASGLLPMGLMVQGDRYGTMIDALEDRNIQNVLFRPIYTSAEEYIHDSYTDVIESGLSTGFEYPEEWQPAAIEEFDIPY